MKAVALSLLNSTSPLEALIAVQRCRFHLVSFSHSLSLSNFKTLNLTQLSLFAVTIFGNSMNASYMGVDKVLNLTDARLIILI